MICFAAIPAVSAQASSATFGTTGSDPYGMVIDSAGNVYVANWGSNDVTKITPDGTFSVNWGPSNAHVTTGTHPVGIVMDSAGNLYTANQGNSGVGVNVSKITPAGVSTPNWAGIDGVPCDIAIDGNGNLYTANWSSNNVTKITPAGSPTLAWATTGSHPHGIAVDSAGNVYTANEYSSDVSKIAPDGTSTVDWGPSSAHVATGSRPYQIAIDTAGNLYTSNQLSDNVSRITPTGVSTVNWGPGGTQVTTGTLPQGITADSAGNVYTANYTSNNVTKITPQGSSNVVGTTGAGPTWIRVDSVGDIYIVDHNANTVSRISFTPTAPTDLIAIPGNTTASIAFTPGSDNGAVFTNYQYSTDDGATWTTRSPASTASPLVLTGLPNLITYRVKLRAINSVRVGVASSAVSVKPAATPDEPTDLVATAGDSSARVTFTAGSDNGAVIRNYEYSTDDGATWKTRSPVSTTSPITISGLTNGTTYRVKLRAVNNIGPSAASSAVAVTPVSAPDAPAMTSTSTSTATTTLHLRTSEAHCSGIICTISGTVPAGATRVVQIATSARPRAVRSGHVTRTVSRVVVNCPITTVNGTQRFTCHARLSAGTWSITTLAKAGSKVIAKSATQVKTTTIPRPAPTLSAVTG
jgi:DNA-binding beta-propeller fold protein YncE